MALSAGQQVIWETGQLSRHYIAEISLNVTLNHNQPTNQSCQMYIIVCDGITKFYHVRLLQSLERIGRI